MITLLYVPRFANGGDEMAMNAEIGLYLQFDVRNGIPKNCPGLEKFTLRKYLKSNLIQLHTNEVLYWLYVTVTTM